MKTHRKITRIAKENVIQDAGISIGQIAQSLRNSGLISNGTNIGTATAQKFRFWNANESTQKNK